MPGRSYDLVRQTPGGNPGDGSLNGALTLQANKPSTTTEDLITAGSDKYNVLSFFNTTNFIQIGPYGNMGVDGSGNFNIYGTIHIYYNVFTKGYGVAPIYGENNRNGLTAVDASPITLYTATASGQLYRLMGRILATAGTSPSATYTIKWTEGGATITKTLTISALDSDSDLSILIQPDNGTAITAQLTAISGTGTTVNVAATVEQMA